jgi:hypothetical protein
MALPWAAFNVYEYYRNSFDDSPETYEVVFFQQFQTFPNLILYDTGLFISQPNRDYSDAGVFQCFAVGRSKGGESSEKY